MAQQFGQASTRVALWVKLCSVAFSSDQRKVVGIDVGGETKGFHGVAMVNGRYLNRRQTRSVRDLVNWCSQEIGAQVVAIDAPCRWRSGKETRTAERELLAQGIRCFLTPRRADALKNSSGFYGWMFRGEALFRAMEMTYPLFKQGQPAGSICCFESFPHAVAWHLQGASAEAANKRLNRLAVLNQHGVRVDKLTNMDWIDAALCALNADLLARGMCMRIYGDERTGCIVMPSTKADTVLLDPKTKS
jgi:predicted nuclease with RNAse H fold